MSTKKTQTQDPPEAPPPPPEGKPFEVGKTTAVMTTTEQKTVTLRLKRHMKASPEKIYKAFTDPDVLAAWLPPHGMVARVHSMDARVGGGFRMSFYTVTKSWESTFGGKYVELVPYRRIVHTDTFETDDPAMKGEMRVTIALTPEADGTLVEIVQEGIPATIAGGSPYGWSQSLDKLAQLVEPELPF